MRPNIFDIAPKELHQDAFITWLLQFADSEFQLADPELNECGKSFVTELIRKHLPNFSEPIAKVKAGRQWEDIDVWAEVNDKFLLVIEDKTSSSHHSNQLARYKENSDLWCAANNYEKAICIYLKTGNESQNSLNEIQKHGYSIFSRLDFINLLGQYQSISNDIYIDFYERLTRLEKSNNEFENKIIEEWDGNDWQGFFQFLEKEIGLKDWKRVNNPSGGFWCAVLNWDYWGDYPVYLQLEEGKLCFKISTALDDVEIPDGYTRGDIRTQLCELILKHAKTSGYEHVRRPDRFGNGNYMTVAVVDRDYWLGAGNQTIDIDTIRKSLLNYLTLLRETTRESIPNN